MGHLPVRFGIVGLGIGRAHANAVTKADGGELVALCDIDEERLKRQAATFNTRRTYTDYRELCADDEVDVVCVCTPNSLHAEVAVCALEHGKHIIVEKPLARSADEGQLILDAARRNGDQNLAMMSFSSRFTGPAQVLRKAVESGQLGEIYYAKASYLRRRGIPGYGGWFTTKSMAGGGPLIDLGVHVLDIAWWLMGCPKPVRCVGATFAKFGPHGKGLASVSEAANGTFDVEDLGCGMILFDNDAAVFVEASWASHVGQTGANVQLFGSRGGASMEPCVIYTDLYGDSTVDIRPEVPQLYGHEGEIQHFIDCIRQNRKPIAPLEHGVVVQRMLDGIYESARLRRECVL